MITTENISLSNEQRDILKGHIKEINDFLGKKYPIATLTLSFSVLIFIVFLIYLYEDYNFSFILKLLTVLPLWAIVVVNLRYFRNRLPAKNIRRLYNKLINDNHYQALRVRSTSCDKYSDSLFDYFNFHLDKKQLLLRLQDFTVDLDKFPNNNFLIPPYELSDVIGDTIICEGEKIEPGDNDKNISNKLIAFRLFEKGRVMVTDKI